ncbi:Methionyl-trna synthetase [Salix suchowensis]|nr:Methionyl-trna synthetase [Salix suchowensis]
MCFVFLCDEEERELGRKQASGSCPHCGGKVQAVDFESRWRFCFLPICYKNKRKYFCALCSRRLELYPS